MEKVLKEKFGIGLQDVPETEWPEWVKKDIEELGKDARVVRKPDGSISIMGGISFGGFDD